MCRRLFRLEKLRSRNITLGLSFVLMLVMLRGVVFAQNKNTAAERHAAAARFSPSAISKMVFDTRVNPKWLSSGTRFWYTYRTPRGSSYFLVDLKRRKREFLFDNHKMASMLTMITKDPYDLQHLPPINPRFNKDESAFQFDVSTEGGGKIFHLEYNLRTQKLSEYSVLKKPQGGFTPGWLNVSPDSAYAVYVKGYDLFYMDKANYQKFILTGKNNVTEHRLTRDGVEGYTYTKIPEIGEFQVAYKNIEELRQPAKILWSPDSKSFAMIKKDIRGIKPLWVINSLTQPRPTLQTYKFQMPGEVDSTEAELLLFTIESRKIDTINVTKYHNQILKLPKRINRPASNQSEVWLSEKPDEIYFSRQSRDLHQYDFCSVNIKTGKVQVLIAEKMNTYMEVNEPIVLNERKEFIHLSERDGWAHFYRYDGSGKLKNQITSGAWHCNYDGYRIDEKQGVLYFSANGREPGENPYNRHFYRVNFDGSGLKLLNPGSFDHSVEVNDAGSFFVDNYSSVNTPPRSDVLDTEGRLVLALETADLSALIATGYKFPEPFSVKAADGVTDIYGVMYKPFNFDPAKTYPIIEYVYPGPQTEAVNRTFSVGMDYTDRMAQLGFIVISLGNRGGSPDRSKWYHNFGYNDMRDYGLADKKYAIEQLAAKYPFININKVGIFGHSGGGFMSAAAICQYPDFYKVAISASGNHDNTIYNHQFTEKYNGIKEVLNTKNGVSKFIFDVETNPKIAANLKGNLLLVTGDRDNNVHPANTLRMADALIKANKRFDMFVLPGQAHVYTLTEYVFWLYADYFTQHLLEYSRGDADIIEMTGEVPKINNN